MDQSNERYWEVVRLYKEGYSYRKIEASLKDRFGITYREIGYTINSYKAAREAEGDFYEAERKAREIIEEATREAKEKKERMEESVAEKRIEWEQIEEMSRGARNTVEKKRDEYRELASSVDSLIAEKRMLMQSVDALERARDFLEEKNRSLEDTYNRLSTQKLPLILPGILASLTTNQITNILSSLPEEKLRKVIERVKRKKGFFPSPEPFWSDFKDLISVEL